MERGDEELSLFPFAALAFGHSAVGAIFGQFGTSSSAKRTGKNRRTCYFVRVSMQHRMTTEQRPWPTLAGRLSQPLTSRVEAVRQLQTTMPITPVAQAVLKQSNRGSSNGPRKTGK